MEVYVRLAITDVPVASAGGDALGDPLARSTRMVWYRVPADWVRDGGLAASRRELLLARLYGAGCVAGSGRPGGGDGGGGGTGGCGGSGGASGDIRHGDGGRYVVLDVQEWVPTTDEARRRPWLTDRAACYVWRAGDVLEEVNPARL